MSTFSVPTLEASFAAIEPKAGAIGRAFYQTLLTRHPELRSLFGSDLDAQGERLMAMVAAGVRLLGRPAQLVPALHGLGRRHVGYGVRDEHYPVVGAVLLDTLAEALGEDWTPEVQAAWTGFYGLVAETMQAGAVSAAMPRGEAVDRAGLETGVVR